MGLFQCRCLDCWKRGYTEQSQDPEIPIGEARVYTKTSDNEPPMAPEDNPVAQEVRIRI